MGNGGGGHWLVRMEWCPAGWSVCLPLLISPCTIKSRSSLLALAHLDGPRKTVVVWCGGVICSKMVWEFFFWYWLTRVNLGKGPLNRLCCCWLVMMVNWHALQRGAASIQRTDGLHHGGAADVELRRRRNDLHPLEGSAATPAGLPHHDQRPHGARLHQVPARLDHLGCAGHHLALGSASFVLFRLKSVLKCDMQRFFSKLMKK